MNTIRPYEGDEGYWEAISQKKSVQLLFKLTKSNKCPMCKYEEEHGWINHYPSQLVSIYKLMPKFLFHIKSSHGIDSELLIDMLRD